MGLWQKIKTTLTHGARKAGKKSGEFSHLSKQKIHELGIKKQLEEKLLDLGGLIYQKAVQKEKLNFEQDLSVRHLIEQIKELEKELELVEAELKEKPDRSMK
ncbi:hypothetical protein [Caldithrix abyssi]|uniref:Uncharacterized protein n=1 Tax=Caldithrix abyssi DSM 13497 TaxID=880073 RepID=H1XY64_CALAY|nr:hypothetical protein [Caldithrix abyssi]APF17936.1 hypothetical protein Cabys_1187 [Caldithrix abyssi DSM 13497]EHO41991.1 hypothetical protein Calab_2381 [Caldithrix abyssi DSM 13497]